MNSRRQKHDRLFKSEASLSIEEFTLWTLCVEFGKDDRTFDDLLSLIGFVVMAGDGDQLDVPVLFRIAEQLSVEVYLARNLWVVTHLGLVLREVVDVIVVAPWLNETEVNEVAVVLAVLLEFELDLEAFIDGLQQR